MGWGEVVRPHNRTGTSAGSLAVSLTTGGQYHKRKQQAGARKNGTSGQVSDDGVAGDQEKGRRFGRVPLRRVLLILQPVV
jgi:hypothetical protein